MRWLPVVVALGIRVTVWKARDGGVVRSTLAGNRPAAARALGRRVKSGRLYCAARRGFSPRAERALLQGNGRVRVPGLRVDRNCL